MTGPEALAAFKEAIGHVNAGRYNAALAVVLIPSDRTLIERRICEAKQRAEEVNANGINL